MIINHKYDEAILLYNALIKSRPKDHSNFHNRAAAYYNLNKIDSAILDLEESIKLNPDVYTSYALLSVIYMQMKYYDLGNRYISIALTKNPTLVQKFGLYMIRGHYWLKKNEFNEALYSFKNALELNKKHPDVYNNIGFTYLNLKKYDEAINYFNKSLNINPDYAYAYNNRGFCYANLGEFEKAFSDFENSFNLDPGNSYLYKFRGIANNMCRNYSKALKDLEKAIEKNPDFEPELNTIVNEIRKNS